MRRSLLVPACLLLLAASQPARAGWDAECCSTYPVYLCPPGYLGYPAPPGEYAATGCGSYQGYCDWRNYSYGYVGCPHITPNPYSCCFYGVTLSNYALITPPNGALPGAPGPLPALTPKAPEKLPEPKPR